jgi:hypothetical protein
MLWRHAPQGNQNVWRHASTKRPECAKTGDLRESFRINTSRTRADWDSLVLALMEEEKKEME